ncbi:hypothetical protein ACK3SF_05160 [Candidatus Nanosalina sp. VS9-1]|uniref:hypothetical protein n=1 Tax=Candidatus Nanosalina sp. VS9-1 TaxID=3388566 RepID=UPI0039DF932B
MTFEIEIEGLDESDQEIDQKLPDFTGIEPDIDRINQIAEEYDYENIVVIGNGGSVTSFRALLYTFMPEVDKNVRIVTTMEPDFLHRISGEYRKEDTLVVPISKSGSTVGVIETLFYFMNKDYDVLPVTSDNDGALRNIVEREGLDYIEHREVGGRFSGMTETALLPAALIGLDVEEIRKGAELMYQNLEEQDNSAYKLASALKSSQEAGYTEILNAIYSTRLFGFKPLFVQLMHETACKRGEGMTVLGDLGPEYQHHTNQRLFGGENDMVPFFIRSEANEARKITVPDEIQDIDLRGRDLGELNGIDLSESLKSEYRGVKEALEEEDMPHVTLTLTDLSYQAAGEMVAFMQILAVYFARFQGVDPFTQPDVEKSKRKGFEARF